MGQPRLPKNRDSLDDVHRVSRWKWMPCRSTSLRVLAEAVDSGSFSAAARKLIGMTDLKEPPLSQALPQTSRRRTGPRTGRKHGQAVQLRWGVRSQQSGPARTMGERARQCLSRAGRTAAKRHWDSSRRDDRHAAFAALAETVPRSVSALPEISWASRVLWQQPLTFPVWEGASSGTAGAFGPAG
jgi:hypothetical protein